MQIFFEKTAPYFLALAAVLIWWYFHVPFPSDNAVLGASLTLGAILTGFLATSKAILMTLDSPVMQRIRETKYISDLVSYLAQAIWLSFSFSLLSLAGFFVDTEKTGYGLLWIFVGISSAACFIRVSNIMIKIVKHSPT